jgi:hypothetical protein
MKTIAKFEYFVRLYVLPLSLINLCCITQAVICS